MSYFSSPGCSLARWLYQPQCVGQKERHLRSSDPSSLSPISMLSQTKSRGYIFTCEITKIMSECMTLECDLSQVMCVRDDRCVTEPMVK